MGVRVSLCMIVKNEEANLPECLASAAGLTDEVIVVDTGSGDRTRELAASLGARVYEFPWCDNFGAARNASLSHATGDWIFWMDADDRLDADNHQRLARLFASLRPDDNIAYMMKCLCIGDPVTNTEARVLDHVRLFRNHPAIRWRYRVHEQILPAILESGGRVQWTDVTVRHTGYQDPAHCVTKRERNLELLMRDLVDYPDDPITLFNIAWTYLGMNRPDAALPFLQGSLERVKPDANFIHRLYALLAKVHASLGDRDQALALCRQGLVFFPRDSDLLFQEASLLFERGDLASAETRLWRLLNDPPEQLYGCLDPEVHGVKARHMLGAIYHGQGRLGEAEAQWQAVLTERPDHTAAWLGLADVWLGLGRGDKLDAALQALEADPQRGVDANVLRGLRHLAVRDYGRARAVLEEGSARYPQSLWPRVLLGEVLVREGRDPDAAERALREALAVDPEHMQTRRNLEQLLARRGSPAAGAMMSGGVGERTGGSTIEVRGW